MRLGVLLAILFVTPSVSNADCRIAWDEKEFSTFEEAAKFSKENENEPVKYYWHWKDRVEGGEKVPTYYVRYKYTLCGDCDERDGCN